MPFNSPTNPFPSRAHSACTVLALCSWRGVSGGEAYRDANMATSRWWIIETEESFNGQREDGAGMFIKWFSSNAFGGTNYSNTPVGAVSHVDEPYLSGVNDAAKYFGLWASGKNFGIAAWNSRSTPFFQALGDPLVRK